MSDILTADLERHDARQLLVGLLRLATGKDARDGDIRPGSVTISVGSIPENSEYRRYLQRLETAAQEYKRDPEALIARLAAERFEDPAKVRGSLENEIKTVLPSMRATAQRSDLVSIEMTGMYLATKDLADYIRAQAGAESVIDHGRYTHGIPNFRCGWQDFPEGLIVTREAFEKVVKPLLAANQIAEQSHVRGTEVRDTTPNDGRATVAFGAELGTARAQSGGCSR